jgi:hypothetical protein
MIFIEKTLTSLKPPWINPKLCRSFIPSIIPAIAIIVAVRLRQGR